jgi:predicted ArsR family transcriptional regulator
MAVLRGLLAKPAPAGRSAGPRKPRQGTKQQQVLALLRRPEGATVAQIAEATGWQAHTVRGFFAGLKKRGIEVSVLERVRQVGPNRAGAKGSYSVYRIAEAA